MWGKFKRFVRGIAVAIAAFLAGLFGVVSHGQSADDNLTWTIPTARENGVALAVTEIKGYEICYSETAGGAKGNCVTVLGGSLTSTTITRTSPIFGNRCYIIRTIDVTDVKSADSAEACKNILARPNAPSGLAVS